MNITLLVIWLVAVVVFAAAEILTVRLVAICFAIGAVCGMAACSFGAPLWVQLPVFFLASLVLLLFARPFVKKFFNVKDARMNADHLIGKTAVVTQDIINTQSRGAVTISGVTLPARSEDGTDIGKGEKAVIKSIEDAKLIVTRCADIKVSERSA